MIASSTAAIIGLGGLGSHTGASESPVRYARGVFAQRYGTSEPRSVAACRQLPIGLSTTPSTPIRATTRSLAFRQGASRVASPARCR